MDAPRLPDPRVLLATPQRASLRVGRRFRRLGRQVREARAEPARLGPVPTAMSVVEVAAALTARPALAFTLGALGLAVLLHVVFGGLTSNIRARKKTATMTTTSVAVAETPLPEDPLPMPPPPPPKAATKTPTTAPAPPSSSSSSAPPSLSAPAVSGVAAGSGGWAMANVRNGTTTAVTSTMPTATPQPVLVAARPLVRAPPRFPPRAQKDGVTGFVVVQIHVGASGEVLDVRVVESQPAGVFDEAAAESVRHWTFVPASADGTPLASWVRQTLRFQLEDT